MSDPGTSPPAPAEVIARRTRRWQVSDQTLTVGDLPLLMGILNVTPDSFSDGGRYFDPAAAVEHGLRLADEGADILDLGAESTRPGSSPVDPDEQLRRLRPVLRQLVRQTPLPLSIDTRSARVAHETLAEGARIINDITGLTGDPQMIGVVARSGCGVCAMHMQGTPETMQLRPSYQNVVAEVFAYLQDRRDRLAEHGIAWERIALDPGIGFGKTTEHNLALLRSAWRFHALECPLLIGHSRKRFLSQPLGEEPVDSAAATAGVAIALAEQGVQVLRVHDVLPVRQAIRLYRATQGQVGQ